MMLFVVYKHQEFSNLQNNSTLNVYYCKNRDLTFTYMMKRFNRLKSRVLSRDCSNIFYNSFNDRCFIEYDEKDIHIKDSFYMGEMREIIDTPEGPVINVG